MSFETLTLADVKITKPSQMPAGDYVFELVPAAQVRYNEHLKRNELNLSAAVADGEYKGRRVFWSYPDPESLGQDGKPMSWSSQAMKKLEIVLGIDSLPGESSVDYFNRAGAQAARFGAYFGPNAKKPYTPAGETEPRNELNFFSVKPAA